MSFGRVGSAIIVFTALPSAALTATTAHAEINGFNSLAGWSYNTGDAGSPPSIVTSDNIHFTTGPNNRRSIWFNTPQDITQFTASFTYRASSISASAARQGVTFTLQNAGLDALGSGGSGLGYSGITPSAAITIETDTGPGRSYSGFYTNGTLGGGSEVTLPVNAFDFHDIDVTITYSGSILSVTMVDGANVYGPHNYFVGSLASVLGSSTAYVGFTAATFNTLGSGGGSNQFLSNMRFGIPSPATAYVCLAFGCVASCRRRS